MMITVEPAEANRFALYQIPEAVWGTLPGSGVVYKVRLTSSSLTAVKETTSSDEIRADRMVPSNIEVAASTKGDVGFELSMFSYDLMWQQFLLGAWTQAMKGLFVKGSAVAVTGASQITIAGVDYTAWLADNQYVKLEGFTNLANNGYFKVNGAPAFSGGNTVITVDESSLVTEAGSAFTKIFDAADVLLKSTSTAFEATNKINGGGANAFAGLGLKVHQKIYIEGLGKETATVTFNADTPAENDTFDISDGVDTLTFEIASVAGSVAPGNVHVALSGAPNTLRTNLMAAINGQFIRETLRVTAATGVAGTKEAGSFAFATTAEVGDQVTVDDGENSVQFTFAVAAAGLTTVAHGGSATDSAANLATAINAHPSLNVTATPTTGTCAIVNDNYVGGELTEQADGGTDITTTDFTSGVAPTMIITNQRGTGGSIVETLDAITAGSFSGGSANKFGFRTIASLPDDDSIVVAETLTTDANSGSLTVVIKGSHLRNPGVVGEITKQSSSFESAYTDIAKQFTHDGCRLGSFSLSVRAGEKVTGSWSLMGRETRSRNSTVLGNTGTYTVLDTTSNEPLNATSNVGTLEKDGVAFTTAITAIELNGDNNLREQRAVGEKFPAGIGYGRFMLSGKITAYFQNYDLYNAFINHETVALAFSFEDADHNRLFFRVPAAKFAKDDIVAEGINRDVMEPLDWMAQRDPVTNTQFMLDRFSSCYPSSVA